MEKKVLMFLIQKSNILLQLQAFWNVQIHLENLLCHPLDKPKAKYKKNIFQNSFYCIVMQKYTSKLYPIKTCSYKIILILLNAKKLQLGSLLIERFIKNSLKKIILVTFTCAYSHSFSKPQTKHFKKCKLNFKILLVYSE